MEWLQAQKSEQELEETVDRLERRHFSLLLEPEDNPQDSVEEAGARWDEAGQALIRAQNSVKAATEKWTEALGKHKGFAERPLLRRIAGARSWPTEIQGVLESFAHLT